MEWHGLSLEVFGGLALLDLKFVTVSHDGLTQGTPFLLLCKDVLLHLINV